jgi:hypothetical protein
MKRRAGAREREGWGRRRRRRRRGGGERERETRETRQVIDWDEEALPALDVAAAEDEAPTVLIGAGDGKRPWHGVAVVVVVVVVVMVVVMVVVVVALVMRVRPSS